MLFAIYMIDRPGGAALRATTTDAHQDFIRQHLGAMYVGGPLLADDAQTIVGSLIVMDFPNRSAAEAFIADEPYNRAGLFESVLIRVFGPVVAPDAADQESKG